MGNKSFAITIIVCASLLVGVSIYSFEKKSAPPNSNPPPKISQELAETPPTQAEPEKKEMQYAAIGLILKDFGMSLKYPVDCLAREVIEGPFSTEKVTYYFDCGSDKDPFLEKTSITTKKFLTTALENIAKISESGTPYIGEKSGEFELQQKLWKEKRGNQKYEFKKINGTDFLISNFWQVSPVAKLNALTSPSTATLASPRS